MDGAPSTFRFGLRTLMELVAVLAVVLAFVYQHDGKKGRFEMIVATEEYKANSNDGKLSEAQSEVRSRFFLLDSENGRVWHRSGPGSWKEETPARTAKQ